MPDGLKGFYPLCFCHNKPFNPVIDSCYSVSPQILQVLCLLPLKLGERRIRPLWGSQVRAQDHPYLSSVLDVICLIQRRDENEEERELEICFDCFIVF